MKYRNYLVLAVCAAATFMTLSACSGSSSAKALTDEQKTDAARLGCSGIDDDVISRLVTFPDAAWEDDTHKMTVTAEYNDYSTHAFLITVEALRDGETMENADIKPATAYIDADGNTVGGTGGSGSVLLSSDKKSATYTIEDNDIFGAVKVRIWLAGSTDYSGLPYVSAFDDTENKYSLELDLSGTDTSHVTAPEGGIIYEEDGFTVTGFGASYSGLWFEGISDSEDPVMPRVTAVFTDETTADIYTGTALSSSYHTEDLEDGTIAYSYFFKIPCYDISRIKTFKFVGETESSELSCPATK